jgi:acid stress-induced BolA-like protein IbaG/YrbA
MNDSQLRKFKKVIGQYKLSVEGNGAHMAVITADGRRVGTLARSDRDKSMRKALGDLIRQGLVDAKEKKVTFS